MSLGKVGRNRWLRCKRLFRWLLFVVFLLCVAKFLWVAVFCIRGSDVLSGKDRVDLMARRNYLVQKIYHESVGVKDMPSWIPPLFQGEWAIVSYSMAAMALTNLVFLYPRTRDQAIQVLDRMIVRVRTSSFRAFDRNKWKEDPLQSFVGNNGHIGYLGHLNIILAARHYLSSISRDTALFHRVSEVLARRLNSNRWMRVATYPGEYYIPDHSVVVASLALYDRLYPGKATGVSQRWLTLMSKRFRDPRTGLFVFQFDADGRVTQPSRGSGSAWNLFYLWYANPACARCQFVKLSKHFCTSFGSFGGFKEWAGSNRGGDLDSGPLLFGVSPAATGFALAGARFSRNSVLLGKLLLTAEVAGFSWQWGEQRRYLVAPFVGNAIVLAMRTVTSWDLRFQEKRQPSSK